MNIFVVINVANIHGFPTPTFTCKNPHGATLSMEHAFFFDGNLLRIVIPSFSNVDEGEYMCPVRVVGRDVMVENGTVVPEVLVGEAIVRALAFFAEDEESELNRSVADI